MTNFWESNNSRVIVDQYLVIYENNNISFVPDANWDYHRDPTEVHEQTFIGLQQTDV